MIFSRSRYQLLSALLMSMATALAAHADQDANRNAAQPTPIAHTSQGDISGVRNNGVSAYLGIPYAAAPVGDLRWQPPQPPASWHGTRDGSVFGQRCAQPLSLLSPESVNEDCLLLNVYVPDDIGHAKLPVMTWIHGGAFLSGSANDYDMSNLARKARAVVVSIDYRVGAFGFFRHPDLAAQGLSSNLGLQDQQAALRWVQSQIGQFGGDASRVTIFGQSAGGASVCLHLVSPQSKGLFQRAILQSGSCHLLTSTPASVMQAQSTALGNKLGCADGPGQLACMRQKSAAEVMHQSVPNGNEVEHVDIRWTPVADAITLPDDPAQMVKQGRFHRVPVMLGTNHDEGRLFVATEYHQAYMSLVKRPQVDAIIQQIANGDSAYAQALSSTYSTQAYGSLDLAFSALLTDNYFSCDALHDAKLFSQHVPTYFYEFTEPDTPTPEDPIMPLGAFHGAELVFVFQGNLKQFEGLPPLNTAQQKLSDRMVRYWGRFAASGQPNSLLPPYWPRFHQRQTRLLNFNSSGITSMDAALYAKDHQCDLIKPY